MSKTRVVVFKPNGGARVLINPDIIPDNALVDPDLSGVAGSSPEYWYLDGDTVRTKEYKTVDAKNKVLLICEHQKKRLLKKRLRATLALLCALGAGYLLRGVM